MTLSRRDSLRSPLLGSRSPSIKSNRSPSIMSESTFRSASRQSNHSSLSPDSVISIPGSFRVKKHPTDLLPRPPAPDFDRTADIMAMRGAVDHLELFEQLLRLCPHPTYPNSGNLTALPLVIRKQIYSILLPPSSRRISLSPTFATKAVSGRDHFANPWDILEPVMGALGAFRFVRQELLTYFWLDFQFYVTLSPFTGPMFCPLSQVWLQDYLSQIQYLTIELDMTRLAGSTFVQAPRLKHDVQKLKGLVDKLVEGLLIRRGTSTMAQLNIICRRYVGLRPPDCENEDLGPNRNVTPPYCDAKDLSFCDSFVGLGDILQSCRLSGFPRPLAEILLADITGDEEVTIMTPEDPVWPSPQPSISSVSTASSQQWSFLAPILEHGAFYDVDEFGNIRTRSSSYDDSEMDEQPPTMVSGYLGVGNASFNNSSLSIASESVTSIMPKGKEFGNLSPAMVSTERFSEASEDSITSGNSYTFTPVSKSRDFNIILRTPSPFRRGLQRRVTAPSAINLTPKTPNTMNRMNEQDPAYLASIQAMRSSTIPRRAASFTESPITLLNAANVDIFVDSRGISPSSGSVNQVDGGKGSSRYMKFVSRLRGQSLDKA